MTELPDLLSLRQELDLIAAHTREVIPFAIDAGLIYDEEAITANALLRIRRLHPALKVAARGKQHESENGADWSWWVGSSTVGMWLGFEIQAKIASTSKGERVANYQQITHPQRNGDLQYDNLLVYAKARGSVAFHVFYNGWPRKLDEQLLPLGADPDRYGCSALPTLSVKHLAEDASERFPLRVDRYAKASVPWSDLFIPPPESGWMQSKGGDPNEGRRSFMKAVEANIWKCLHAAPGISNSNDVVWVGITEEPPSDVIDFAESRAVRRPEDPRNLVLLDLDDVDHREFVQQTPPPLAAPESRVPQPESDDVRAERERASRWLRELDQPDFTPNDSLTGRPKPLSHLGSLRDQSPPLQGG